MNAWVLLDLAQLTVFIACILMDRIYLVWRAYESFRVVARLGYTLLV